RRGGARPGDPGREASAGGDRLREPRPPAISGRRLRRRSPRPEPARCLGARRPFLPGGAARPPGGPGRPDGPLGAAEELPPRERRTVGAAPGVTRPRPDPPTDPLRPGPHLAPPPMTAGSSTPLIAGG